MKTKFLALALVGSMMVVSPSCTTAYDAYGRPIQTVDPGVAAAGVVAAGLVGYALADQNDGYYHRQHYRGRSYKQYYPTHRNRHYHRSHRNFRY